MAKILLKIREGDRSSGKDEYFFEGPLAFEYLGNLIDRKFNQNNGHKKEVVCPYCKEHFEV